MRHLEALERCGSIACAGAVRLRSRFGPVGGRTLARTLPIALLPAATGNVLADLTDTAPDPAKPCGQDGQTSQGEQAPGGTA